MKPDFLFVFDNIIRDLPSIALLSFKLKQKKYECEVIHLTQLNHFLKHSSPKVLILNKPFLNNYDLILRQIFGMKICVLHTEGAMGARFLEKSKPKIDLYLFWNTADKELYKKRNPWDKIDHPVVGCHRTDFLFEPLAGKIFSKDSSINHLEEGSQLLVSLASPGGYAGVSESYINFKQKQINKLSENKIDMRRLLSIEAGVANFAYQIIEDILKSKLNIKLFFKPHPNENVEFWHDKLSGLRAENKLIFVTDKDISTVLDTVDVHICSGHCQTLSEAIMMGVYAIGFNPQEANNLFNTDWMEIGAPHARNSSDVLKCLKNLITSKKQDQLKHLTERQNNLNIEYINKFFEYRDGQVCDRCVDQLVKLHKDYSNSFSLSGLNLDYLLASFFSFLRRKFSFIFRKYLGKKQKFTVMIEIGTTRMN